MSNSYYHDGGAFSSSSSSSSRDDNANGGEKKKKNLQQQSLLSPVVDLNVGGFKFTTSRASLCRFPGSHLEAMFSGRHGTGAIVDSRDGSYFIDRDGR